MNNFKVTTMKNLLKELLAKLIQEINAWLKSFVSSDKKETFVEQAETKVESKPKPQIKKETEEEEEDSEVSSDPEDPKTNWKNPQIMAMLWKPESDTSHDSVVVAWSDNISYKDLYCLIEDDSGKVMFDGGVYSHYVRGLNKHGKYGGINFKVGPNSKYRGKKPIIRFYVVRKGGRKFVPIDGNDQIQVLKIKQRLEVNYKSNMNYRK